MKINILKTLGFAIILFFMASCGDGNTNNNVSQISQAQRDSLLKIFEAKIISGDTLDLSSRLNLLLKNSDSNVNDLCRIAEIKIQMSDIKSAIELLNKAQKIDNKNSNVYYTKGLAYSTIYPLDSVISLFSLAIKYSPDSLKYLLARARIYDEMGNDTFALKDVERALLLNSNHLESHALKTAFLSNLEDWVSTIKAANIAIPLIEKSNKSYYYQLDKLYYSRALAHLKLNKFDLAVKDVNKALQLNSKSGHYYCLRALAKNHLGDKDGSYEDFKKSAELGDPEGTEYFKQYEEYKKSHKKI